MDGAILKIGVTGSAGSGKSLVCRRFRELGLVVLDCDRIARQVVAPGEKGFDGMVRLFGRPVLSEDGTLDRPKLRAMILSDPTARKKMEKLLHPLILERMMHGIQHADYGEIRAAAVEVPLLFESGMDRFFDRTIAVVAKEVDLVDRIARRDAVETGDARRMLALQMPQTEKEARADHIIRNTGTLSELFESVDLLFRQIQKECLTRSGFCPI